MTKKFQTVAVGGTFDSFHRGHEKILLEAFKQSEKVLVGLTDEKLTKKLVKKHFVESYESRRDTLENFLYREGLHTRAEIVSIDNIYGVTHFLPNLNAVVVSEETYSRALEINEIRRKSGLKRIEIIVVKKMLAEDNKPISATRIRLGETDRNGKVLRS
ncbi:MAG: pantetheine-phosphate adenylyltransferase [Candidatus Bathyarchaeota archaeon]